jgi:hypothetical protein
MTDAKPFIAGLCSGEVVTAGGRSPVHVFSLFTIPHDVAVIDHNHVMGARRSVPGFVERIVIREAYAGIDGQWFAVCVQFEIEEVKVRMETRGSPIVD